MRGSKSGRRVGGPNQTGTVANATTLEKGLCVHAESGVFVFRMQNSYFSSHLVNLLFANVCGMPVSQTLSLVSVRHFWRRAACDPAVQWVGYCMLLACSASVFGPFYHARLAAIMFVIKISFLESKKGAIGIFVSVSVRAS